MTTEAPFAWLARNADRLEREQRTFDAIRAALPEKVDFQIWQGPANGIMYFRAKELRSGDVEEAAVPWYFADFVEPVATACERLRSKTVAYDEAWAKVPDGDQWWLCE